MNLERIIYGIGIFASIVLLGYIFVEVMSNFTWMVDKMDRVEELGITIEKDDTKEVITGVGGSEFVYKKNIDGINLGNLVMNNFIIEVGVMDYGFEIDGIIGMDFLQEVRAIIDLDKMAICD